KAQDHVTSAIVPPKPLMSAQRRSEETKTEKATVAETPAVQAAPAQGLSSLSHAMYKGSTPAAPGMHKLTPGEHTWSILGRRLAHSLRVAMKGLAALRGAWA